MFLERRKISQKARYYTLHTPHCVLRHCVIFPSRRNFLRKGKECWFFADRYFTMISIIRRETNIGQIIPMEILCVTEQEGIRNSALLRKSIPLTVSNQKHLRSFKKEVKSDSQLTKADHTQMVIFILKKWVWFKRK